MLNIAISLVIGYFRWTQLFPMIAAWVIAAGVLMLTVVSVNEEATGQIMESVGQKIEAVPGLSRAFGAMFDYVFSEEEAEKHPFEAFKSVVLKAWGIASLGLMLLAWLLGMIFGPFKPWTLRKKLKVTLLACLGLETGYFACFLAFPDQFHGQTSIIIMNFLVWGVAVFLLSTWSLTISHMLGKWQQAIAQSDGQQPRKRASLG